MLKNLEKQGITILVSTPYMDEASLCDRIGLIQNGSFLTIAINFIILAFVIFMVLKQLNRLPRNEPPAPSPPPTSSDPLPPISLAHLRWPLA